MTALEVRPSRGNHIVVFSPLSNSSALSKYVSLSDPLLPHLGNAAKGYKSVCELGHYLKQDVPGVSLQWIDHSL
jgi:hypothetical protein